MIPNTWYLTNCVQGRIWTPCLTLYCPVMWWWWWWWWWGAVVMVVVHHSGHRPHSVQPIPSSYINFILNTKYLTFDQSQHCNLVFCFHGILLKSSPLNHCLMYLACLVTKINCASRTKAFQLFNSSDLIFLRLRKNMFMPLSGCLISSIPIWDLRLFIIFMQHRTGLCQDCRTAHHHSNLCCLAIPDSD